MGIYCKQWAIALILETFNPALGQWVQSAPVRFKNFDPMTKAEAERWAMELTPAYAQFDGKRGTVVVVNLASE